MSVIASAVAAVSGGRCAQGKTIGRVWNRVYQPSPSLQDQTLIHEKALAACPFVVVQEAFATAETCQLDADPAAVPPASLGRKSPAA